MALSKAEINLRRLLSKCELILKSKQNKDERFPQYVQSLETMIEDLVKTTSITISDEAVSNYRRRIHNLKFKAGLSNQTFDELLLEQTTIKELNKVKAREELLGLRQRDVKKGAHDMDELIDYHENMQQKIADDMLTLTRNLKEQSMLANKIIRKDTAVVNNSTQLTEQNFTKLKVESAKLTEHSKRAWKCWMWIMLLIVLVVFINMVLFMKVMKKKY